MPYKSNISDGYPFLVPTGGKGLLDHYSANSGFFICKEIMKGRPYDYVWGQDEKRFNLKYFRYSDYLDYAMTVWKAQLRLQCCYEVIFGGPQKVYFDIDVKANFEGDSDDIIRDLISSILKVYPKIKFEDIVVFTSHGERKDGSPKKSYHLVVHNWYVYSHKVNGAFSQLVLPQLNPAYREHIDWGLYKSIQNFRIYKNHKFDSFRFKDYSEELSGWKPTEVEDKLQFREILFASLVSVCILENEICINIPVPVKHFSSRDLDEDEVKRGLILLEEVNGWNSFKKIDKIENNFIHLKRMSPSMCPICARVHEHQNPYIYVSEYGYYWSCRRSNQKIFLGNVPSEANVRPSGLKIVTRATFNRQALMNLPQRKSFLVPPEKVIRTRFQFHIPKILKE